MKNPQTTNDAEALATKLIHHGADNCDHVYTDPNFRDAALMIQTALTAAYERGKADVVPSGDADWKPEKHTPQPGDANYERWVKNGCPGIAFMQLLDERDAARAEGERIGFERAQQWQPIATAPKDAEFIGYWENSGCMELMIYSFKEDDFVPINFDEVWSIKPTHWQPLPDAPKEKK